MRLYLVQHGQARPEEEDPGRGLSEQGRQNAERTASFASDSIGVKPDVIIHSGKKRARETADIMAEHLGPGGGVGEAVGLDPMDEPSIWAARLAGEEGDIMLVGHLPHLGRLASRLLAAKADGTVVNFQNAGIVCLERGGDGRWFLNWAVTPGMLG